MFAAQQAYSQQLSTQMPQPYGGYQGQGLGAMGFQGGMVGGGSYAYANQGQGYGPGNAFGDKMSSAIFGAGSAAGGAMSWGGAALGGMIGGVPGALLGGGIGMVAGGVTKHIFNSMAAGAQEQSAVERTLSQFQFQNASSQTGKGFSRSDAMQVGNMVRQMERVPEMLTSFGELNRIMDKMGQMGLMQGVRDVGEFQSKFRDTIKTLKTMSKVLGGTMEEALQAMQESRRAGFYSNADLMKNTVQRATLASVSGMNQQQIGALQQFGGEIGHATGGSRASGARNITRTAGQLGLMNQQGMLSNDDIMEMSGKEGAEGIQDIAGQMAQLSYRMSHSSLGTASTLALAEMKDGKFTGKMDQALVEKYRRGEISLTELKTMAQQKVSTRGAKMSFKAHEGRLRSEMASSTGSEGQAMMLQEMLGERGWDNPDATNIVMERMGVSEEQANLLQKTMPNLKSLGRDLERAGKEEARGSVMKSLSSEQGSWDAMKHKFKTKLKHYTTDWAKDIGVGVRDYFASWADEFMDDLHGNYREVLTKRMADTWMAAGAGSKDAAKRLTQMSGRAKMVTGGMGGSRMDVGSSGGLTGIAARAGHWWNDTYTAGDQAIKLLENVDQGKFLSHSNVFQGGAEGMARRGDVVLDSSWLTQSATGISKENQKKAMARLQALGDTGAGGEGMKEWEKLTSGGNKGVGGSSRRLTEAYRAAMASGEIGAVTDPGKKTELIEKKMREHLSASGDEDVMDEAKKKGFSGVNLIAAIQAKEAQSGNKYAAALNLKSAGQNILGELDMSNQLAVSKALKQTDSAMAKKLTGGEGDLSWGDVKHFIDSGSQIGSLLAGNDVVGGLTSKTKAQLGEGEELDTRGKNAQQVREILSRFSLEKGFSAKDKEWLDSHGMNAGALESELKKEAEKNPGIVDALGKMAGRAPEADILKYAALTDASGLNKIAADYRRQGEEETKHLTDVENTEEVKLLTDTKGGLEGSAVFSGLKEEAKLASEVDVNAPGFSSGETAKKLATTSVENAQRIMGMKDKKKQAIAKKHASAATQAALERMEDVEKKYGGGKMGGEVGKGKTADEILEEQGFKAGSEGYEDLKKQIEEKLGTDKRLNAVGGKGTELADVKKILGSAQATAVRARTGEEQKNKYVSEQQVADALKGMTDNNVKVAGYLKEIATGQPAK